MKKVEVRRVNERDPQDTRFSVFLNVFLIANILRWRIMNGLFASPEQRNFNPKKSKGASDVYCGKKRLSGRKNNKYSEDNQKINYNPDSFVLNITNNKVLCKERNKWYLIIPETEEEMAKYAIYWNFLDGQHRIMAFTKEYCQINCTDYYPAHFYVYPDHPCSPELFTTMNGLNSKPSATLNFMNNVATESVEAEVMEMESVCEILAEKKVYNEAKTFHVKSEIYDDIDFGHGEGKYPVNSLCEYTCISSDGQHVKDNNIIAMFKKLGFNSLDDMAYAFNLYMIAWNRAASINYEMKNKPSGEVDELYVNHDMFRSAQKNKGGVSLAKGRVGYVYGMSCVIAEIFVKKHMSWNVDNLMDIICTLMNDIIGVKALQKFEALRNSGRSDVYRAINKTSNALRVKCDALVVNIDSDDDFTPNAAA